MRDSPPAAVLAASAELAAQAAQAALAAAVPAKSRSLGAHLRSVPCSSHNHRQGFVSMN